MGAGHEARAADQSALRGHDGQLLFGTHHSDHSPLGNIQSGRSKPRQGVVRRSGVHGRSRCRGYASPLGSGANTRIGEGNADLSSLYIRAVRQGAGSAPTGEHSVLSPIAIRSGQAVCFLDHEELSRELRHVCRQWHSLQP